MSARTALVDLRDSVASLAAARESPGFEAEVDLLKRLRQTVEAMTEASMRDGITRKGHQS